MVSRADMESDVAEVIAGQVLVLEARLQQAKDFVEQLDAKTAFVNAKVDELAAAACSAHERISVIVNDMNVAKTAIELKFGEVHGDHGGVGQEAGRPEHDLQADKGCVRRDQSCCKG